MQTLLNAAIFLAGLVILLKGASIFTENASKTARSLGVSDMVIGLTMVAFTTSLPELSVTVMSVFREAPGLALGNVIGSNIANVGLVLGLAALLSTNIKSGDPELRQGYIMVIITVLVTLLIVDGLTPVKGIVMIGGLLAYTYYLSREKRVEMPLNITGNHRLPRNLVLSLIGGAGVILGAEMLVSSSINMASNFNVPETLIGLTIVAVGTSLPEIATTLTAAFKKLGGIALGNIIGSNVFNLLMVLGAASLIGNITMDAPMLMYSVPMMILLSVLLVIFMKIEKKLGKNDGIALLLLYAFFIYMKLFLTPS